MQTVAETPLFRARAERILTEDELTDLISYLAVNPTAGKVIPGTGGLRKLRVGAHGKGTRGGARVIFYTYDTNHPVLAILVYGKGESDDLSAESKRLLSKMVGEIKAAWRAK